MRPSERMRKLLVEYYSLKVQSQPQQRGGGNLHRLTEDEKALCRLMALRWSNKHQSDDEHWHACGDQDVHQYTN